MTNADKIKAMSIWELAKFIYDVSNEDTQITNCKEECKKCKYSDVYYIFQIGEWLISE